MRLIVNNVARVSCAEISLDGISVIAGANGTGKSTISRSLMTLSSISRRMPELVQRERINSVLRLLRKGFGKYGADLLFPPLFLQSHKNDWAKWLSIEWWNSDKKVLDWLRSDSRLIIFPDEFRTGNQCAKAIIDIRNEILSTLNRAEQEYVEYICKKAFNRAFNDQVKPVFSKTAQSKISICDDNIETMVEFIDGEISGFDEIGRAYHSSVAYFEPLNYLDFSNQQSPQVQDRYSAGQMCICKAMRSSIDESHLSLEEANELKEIRDVIAEIVGIIRGKLVEDSQGLHFSEKFSNEKTELIDIQNIASGMKTMATIVRMGENRLIRKGSLLIIDEPESNLHPEWQVKFALFLILLSKKLNIHLLLNTHSPYFLQAIRKYSEKESVVSHYYTMVLDDNQNSYHSEEVTNNLSQIFRTMSTPFNNLIG